MALAASDFVYPAGFFKSADFPDETLTDTLTAFLTKALTLSSDEAVQTAYVNYRGYAAICDRLNAGLIREKRLQAEGWMDPAQLAYFKEQRDRWEAEYNALSGSAGGIVWGEVAYVEPS